MQAAAPPTVDSEQTEQPRFAARTFNSDLSFDVYAQDTYSPVKELIGHTPSAVPLKIQTCWMWQVRPIGPVEDWNLLIREIDREEIPGLMLRGVEVTDSELKKLAGLARLRSLDLGLTGARPIRPITDAGWESLKGMACLGTMPHLRALILSGTQITDAALEHIKSMTELQDLMLQGTSITDNGLEHLKGLTKLRRIALLNTQVTDAGAQQLQRALPDLSLMRPPAR